MSDEIFPLHQLLQDDPRYPLDAYLFVRDGLAYAADVLHLGNDESMELEAGADEGDASEPTQHTVRHLTGGELCEAIRVHAVGQFGFMAKLVLNNWGIHTTSDFGNIVYNMIHAGLMRKSKHDRREHFDDIYDFSEVFERQFEMKLSEGS